MVIPVLKLPSTFTPSYAHLLVNVPIMESNEERMKRLMNTPIKFPPLPPRIYPHQFTPPPPRIDFPPLPKRIYPHEFIPPASGIDASQLSNRQIQQLKPGVGGLSIIWIYSSFYLAIIVAKCSLATKYKIAISVGGATAISTIVYVNPKIAAVVFFVLPLIVAFQVWKSDNWRDRDLYGGNRDFSYQPHYLSNLEQRLHREQRHQVQPQPHPSLMLPFPGHEQPFMMPLYRHHQPGGGHHVQNVPNQNLINLAQEFMQKLRDHSSRRLGG